MTYRRSLAVAAVATGLAFAGMAPANASNHINCDGVEVPRCVQVQRSGGGVRATSWIDDAAGGRDFSVSVNSVMLYKLVNGSWQAVAGSGDYDGWHAQQDTAATGLISQCGAYFKAVTWTQYKGAEANGYWQSTGSVWIDSGC